jgi:hypothetical protein
MKISPLINFFIPKDIAKEPEILRRTRLVIRACFLTSLFSSSYIALSVYFEYEKGVYFMLLNAIGFLRLPFLINLKTPLLWVGHLCVLIGATAIIALT